jgi:hypothetical protein
VPIRGWGDVTGFGFAEIFAMEGELEVAFGLRGCGQVSQFGPFLSASLQVELLERIDFRGVQWLASCHS